MTTQRVNMNTCTTKKNARRSQVWDCFLKLRSEGRNPILMDSSKGWSFVCVPDSVQPQWAEDLAFLDALPRREAQAGEPPFVGGWVGFLSYDWGLKEMGLTSKHKAGLPLMWWKYCMEVYAFEVVNEDAEVPADFVLGALEAGMSYAEYEAKIAKIHALLRDGECYQINLTQPFRGSFEGDPFALYAALFQKNPSAMCFYAEDEDWALCSNSPERLVSLRGDVLRAEPIKGTVGANEDPQFLLKDEKSYAELTMIVDLLRNDLGRVAELGSVRVLEHQALMALKNVWHTYSVIEAKLAPEHGVADLLRAVFPGGSITGCPKKRAMQWIDLLENFSRGAYCGSAGYVSLNGNADFNIMIRTGTVQNGQLEFPVGGGIVVDSQAHEEWEEQQKKLGVVRGLSLN
jgi:anthranilate/para-aminobenzoate synthase component I